MTDDVFLGGCMCGAIRYEATGPLMFVVLCHCRMCQQWTGSAMLGSATFPKGSVNFVKGTPKIHQSSAVCDRGFCGECGSSLFTQYAAGSVFDSVKFVSIGTLDDPERAHPNVHYGAEAELSWMRRDDGLQRICIDVDNPAQQEELFKNLMAQGVDSRHQNQGQPDTT